IQVTDYTSTNTPVHQYLLGNYLRQPGKQRNDLPVSKSGNSIGVRIFQRNIFVVNENSEITSIP
ncbi:MAG: hypothetical protein ACK4IY_01300, partial [Chitinophagales bacterium]